ncbi:MAG TPA: CorA family divalent cation transporter [Polyangiaceae bacterium]|nr:CorA family divalent cation transporter [Polyangiaceae bacterium]
MLLAHPDEDPAAAAWVDLCEPTVEELGRIRTATGLRVPDLAQISEIESTSRLAFENGAYYLSTSFVAPRPDGDLVMVPVGFVLSGRVLLTMRFGPVAALDAAHEAAAAQGVRTAEEAFLLILETVVDRAADKLEVAGVTCDQLSATRFVPAVGRGSGAT